MSGRLLKFTAIVLATVAYHGTIARGQGRTSAVPDSLVVPRDLVEAIIGGYRTPGTPPPKILVGTLPDDFPRALLSAPNVEILGSVQFGPLAGRGLRSTVIGVVRENPDSAISALKRIWESHGWKALGAAQSSGGFVPTPMTRPFLYCSDSSVMTTFATPRSAGGNYLRFDFSTGQGPTPCAMQAMRPITPPVPDYSFPTLVAPAGARSLNNSMGGSASGREASVLLETDMTPTQLIAHYAPQLKTAGWTLGETAMTRVAVVQVAESKDSKGRTLTGILTALLLPQPRSKSVSFKILSPDNPGYSGYSTVVY